MLKKFRTITELSKEKLANYIKGAAGQSQLNRQRGINKALVRLKHGNKVVTNAYYTKKYLKNEETEETAVDELNYGTLLRYRDKAKKDTKKDRSKGVKMASKRLGVSEGDVIDKRLAFSSKQKMNRYKQDNDNNSSVAREKSKTSAKIIPFKKKTVNETLSKNASVSTYVHDFVHSQNKMFSGDSKKQRIRRALGAYYHRKHK